MKTMKQAYVTSKIPKQAQQRAQSKRAQSVKKTLAECFYKQAGNPLFRYLTLTRVEMSSDSQYATVYVTLLASSNFQHSPDSILDTLRKAKPFFRSKLAKLFGRGTPLLRFQYDPSSKISSSLASCFAKIDFNSPP